MADTFQVTFAMTANQQQYNPLSAWFGRFPNRAVLVTVLVNATTTGVRMGAQAGSRTAQPVSQVQGAGVAGTLPNPLSTAAVSFVAMPGEEIQLLFNETLAGTPTVNLTVTTDG